jgi:hypothetical protein
MRAEEWNVMAKYWGQMTISEKLGSLREQLGEILDELHVMRPDVAQTCGHLSLDDGRNVKGHPHNSALGPNKAVPLSTSRH